MARSIRILALASLAALALTSVTVAPPAQAQGRQGAHGGGRAHAGGAQVNNSNRDARANQVRNTSVNNVNRNVNRSTSVNRSTNVNVHVDNHGGGWDNDYHPVAAAAAIAGTAAIIGSIVARPPAGCVPVNYGGIVYQQCGATWYVPQGSQYAVVAPPY